MTRFRGMISTQPGSTPLASFKIVSLEDSSAGADYISSTGNDIGRSSIFSIISFFSSHENFR